MQIKPTIIAAIAMAFAPALTVGAQTGSHDGDAPWAYESRVERSFFNRFDLGLSLGTTGVGLDLSANITRWARLRVGVDYMPEVSVPMSFNITSYQTDADGNMAVTESNFARLQEMMEGITSVEVDEKVEMEGKPKFCNFKLLVDIMPLRDKRWHLTAGFYYGSSRIATASNTIEEMPSLLAVNIYNHYYDFAASGRYWDEPMIPGYNDFFMAPEMADKLLSHGAVGIHVGEFSHDIYNPDGSVRHAKGTPYIMRPGSDGLVRARAKVNKFRPYLGVGYSNDVGPGKRLSIGFDAGVMFWGGSPQVITHEGIDLVNDVENVRGKVGDYVDIIDKFKVFPAVTFRIAYRLF